MSDQQQTARPRLERRRQYAPGALIEPDGNRMADTCVVESGLVAMSIALDHTPLTCVGLLSEGSLFSFHPGVGGARPHYRAVGPAAVTEIPAQMRAAGAATIYFDLSLNKRVGIPAYPDPRVAFARCGRRSGSALCHRLRAGAQVGADRSGEWAGASRGRL